MLVRRNDLIENAPAALPNRCIDRMAEALNLRTAEAIGVDVLNSVREFAPID